MRLLPRRSRPTASSAAVARRVPGWDRLTGDQRERLVAEADAFAGHVRWEAAHGFTLTDEMRGLIAAHAALLTLELPDGVESYRSVTSVIVHRTTIVQSGHRSLGNGLYTDSPEFLAGQAHHKGPVLVAWDATRRHLRHPHAGENVLFHEFAHRLDMLDGVVDGTPPLGDQEAIDHWVTVLTESYQRLRAGRSADEAPHALRPYAGTDPGEFFAVATEAFFTVPSRVRAAEPALYDVLAGFYRQDPDRAM